MRNDFRYLHNSLGFSALIACPAFFMITSSAFSPICLQNRIQYSNLKPIIWFRRGSKSPGHQEHDWILKCDKGFPFHKIWNMFSFITSTSHLMGQKSTAYMKTRMQEHVILLALQIHLFNLCANSSGNTRSSSPHIINVGCIKNKA